VLPARATFGEANAADMTSAATAMILYMKVSPS
jgi:hypothetical protein